VDGLRAGIRKARVSDPHRIRRARHRTQSQSRISIADVAARLVIGEPAAKTSYQPEGVMKIPEEESDTWTLGDF